MFRGFIGQAVGVVSITVWLALSVYFLSRASEPNVTDGGNWFLYFALLTIAFVAVMSYWSRFFSEEH